MTRHLESFPDPNDPVPGIQAGDFAMFDAGPTGDNFDAVVDPINNLAKLDLHSRLDYRRVKYEKQSTDPGMSAVSVPDTAQTISTDFVLFAHGLGFRPLVAGEIAVGGLTQAISGSVLAIGSNGYVYLTLSADATNVYLNVNGWFPVAMTVAWTVRVFEEEFQSPSTPAIEMSSDLPFAKLGPLSAEYFYVRENTVAPDFTLVGGQTIDLRIGSTYPEIHFGDGTYSFSVKCLLKLFGVIPALDPPGYSVSKTDCSF